LSRLRRPRVPFDRDLLEGVAWLPLRFSLRDLASVALVLLWLALALLIGERLGALLQRLL
jgi:hypothetical protein